MGLELGAVFLHGLPCTIFEAGLLCIIAGTVAILAQGTSWAVAVTQAFLTQVRFPLGPGPWRVWFSQIPESLRLLNSGSFFPLDFCLFLSSMHLLHLMGEAGPSRVLETHLTMCDK